MNFVQKGGENMQTVALILEIVEAIANALKNVFGPRPA